MTGQDTCNALRISLRQPVSYISRCDAVPAQLPATNQPTYTLGPHFHNLVFQPPVRGCWTADSLKPIACVCADLCMCMHAR